MPRQYFLESVLLPQGWTHGASITVADDGFISSIAASADSEKFPGNPTLPRPPLESERIAGIIVPGMPNAHSHAFQRGMVGNAEYRLSASDSFWTWRQTMYALANRIEPDDLQILATQLFIEMLKAGYTSVAEFHYLHRQSNGDGYAGINALWEAISHAADTAGIALTFLPTLYQTSEFGAQPLKREQARFAMETQQFLRAVEDRIGAERRTSGSTAPTVPSTLGIAPGMRRTGAAFHSLRAVPLPTLREATQALRSMDPALPLHIHVAEQVKEVEACKLHTGRRPIELLLDSELLDSHWCLVHATHATTAEMKGIAAANATVCVSISTEANLGDGFFDANRFLKLGGRVCVGSDSQATVCPAEELRWMEYQQRLRNRRRGMLTNKLQSHVGTHLWCEAAKHGGQAIGQPAGVIAVGQRADWLALDAEHPSMVGAPLENAIDHLVFAGGHAAIRDVMVAGRWVVKDHRHSAELPLRGRFSELMSRLAAQ